MPDEPTQRHRRASAPPPEAAYPMPPDPEDEQRVHREPAPQRRSLRPALRVLLAVACVCVLCYCVVSLIRYGMDWMQSEQTSDELRQLHAESAITAAPTEPPAPTDAPRADETLAPTAAPTIEPTPEAAEASASDGRTRVTRYPNNPTMTASLSILKLQERNKDIVGWLTIDGVLDEAVVQRDNAYYLTHDYLGRGNAAGALFLDEGCKLATVPEKLVIHGHNMKTGQMFGALKKYKVKGVDFFKQNYLIRLESLYEDARYVVFAVAECDTRASERRFLDFISSPVFDSDEAFTRFAARLKELSMYACDVDVRPGDRLLLLATCTSNEEHGRLIVAARMVRPDEDDLALRMSVYTARSK